MGKKKQRLKKEEIKKILKKKSGRLEGLSQKLKNKIYNQEIERLQTEMVKLEEWIKHKGLKVVVLFEGRDAAGKGGVIKRMVARTNPRTVRIAALGTPTEREKTQWYFQRYAAYMPAAGEMVLFDRSWYNRAGVERVMGFCTDAEYWDFLKFCPQFEKQLIQSGTILIKYWFSVSDEVQEERFQERLKDPARRWKLSPMDLEARARWVDYSRAKDVMFEYTDTKRSPWNVVDANDKKCARLNCMSHLLASIPYKDVTQKKLAIPERQKDKGYQRPPLSKQRFVPAVY